LFDTYCGDVIDWALGYEGEKFHALLCDPPYELNFMGKDWDSSGTAFNTEVWAALSAHLYPGAFGLAFASSRGWHRMAVAIEDAGMIIHPSIFLWYQFQGFPKATRIDTRINPETGQEDQSSELSSDWQGHRYGLQAMKPAVEPIILWQKPYDKSIRTIDNIVNTGAGALWIDGARLESKAKSIIDGREDKIQVNCYGKFGTSDYDGSLGRWPPNFALVHSPECTVIECSDNCPVATVAEQAGDSRSRARIGRRSGKELGTYGEYPGQDEVRMGYDDDGSKVRFLPTFDWVDEVTETLYNADKCMYAPKVSNTERHAGVPNGNRHVSLKPINLTRWLATLLSPPERYSPRRLLVPFAGAHSEIIGASLSGGWEFIQGIELNQEYIDIGKMRVEYWMDAASKVKTSDAQTIAKCEETKPLPNAIQMALI